MAAEPVAGRAGRTTIGAVLALWDACRSEHAVTADTPERVGALLATAPDALLVAELDGALVGAVIGAWDGWRGNFYRLAVRPEHRRRGIARRLVDGRRGAAARQGSAAGHRARGVRRRRRRPASGRPPATPRDPVIGRMVRTLAGANV